jgi:hypothetical protein
MAFDIYDAYYRMMMDVNRGFYSVEILRGKTVVSGKDISDYGEIPKLIDMLIKCGYGKNCQGLYEAMNYQMPAYKWYDIIGNYMALEKGRLKAMLAPIRCGWRIYRHDNDQGDWIVLGHWIDDKWYEYMVNGDMVLMRINRNAAQQVDSAEASTIAVPPSTPPGSPR